MNIYRDLKSLPEFKNAVVTIGSFDGVHQAHRRLVYRIQQLADEIEGEAVVVTFHPHPRSVVFPNDKSLQLLTTTNEKIELFRQCGVKNLIIVPFTVEFAQLSAREYVEKFLIGQLKASFLVVGYDHKFGLARQGDFQMLRMYEKEGHFKLVEIEKQELDEIDISSTNIRKALVQGDLRTANALLGSPYYLMGKVIKGDGIGKTIGYPTANIQIETKAKLIPQAGIYACYVNIGKSKFGGMLYIGNRPTVTSKGQQTIEVNIFDFNDNIYEEEIGISFVSFVRVDEKYENLEALKNQLDVDLKEVRQILKDHRLQEKTEALSTLSILNYNGEEYLEAYLPSVLKSSAYPLDLVVVDNASTDDSRLFLKEWFPEIKLVELSKNYGFADGYNKGNREIKTKYTVLLNSDVKVTEGWLDGIIEMMEADDRIAGAQPKICSMEQTDHFEYAGAAGGFIDALGYPFCRGRIFDHVEGDHGQYDEAVEVFWTSGAAMVVRTDLFQKFGGFDKHFFAHQEEIDFCWRLKRAGYKFMVYPKSVVYHLGGGTLEYDKPRKTFLNFRNNLNTILKNEQSPKVALVFLARLVLDGVAGFKFLLDGKFQHTLAILRAHLSVYLHFIGTMGKRERYRLLRKKYNCGGPNLTGQKKFSILWKFHFQKKKKFSQL
ncbi:MAG TPA: bifunctional riboflavin kinase/FAD synthetase [Saprospiraceae bacterium]|nr:bifunctional riboflavin kinase/FAD synthetase [Saprospiraceae bacterium]HRG65043.1 bifunctional riboflavin kinase/FAD synthetase [Saprospiraceae bacterium]